MKSPRPYYSEATMRRFWWFVTVCLIANVVGDWLLMAIQFLTWAST